MYTDYHTHTIASGHGTRDTIDRLARAAAAKGIQILGISDHAPAMPGSASISYFRNLRYSARERYGVRLCFGAELNVLDFSGKVDLPEDILRTLDYAVISLHPQCFRSGTAEQNTTALIRAMAAPHVRIIGHPDDEKYPLDYDALVMAAKKAGVLPELNNSSLSPHGYRGDSRRYDILLLEACARHNVPIILGSDSHGAKHVGDFTWCRRLLEETAFPAELVRDIL